MKRTQLNYKTALSFSVGISLLMNLLFFIMFFYGRDAVLPPDGEHPPKTFEISAMMTHLLFNFLIAFFLYVINFRLLKLNHYQYKFPKWLYIAIITFVCAGILSYCFSLIQIHIQDIKPHPERFIRGGMFRDYFIAVVVILSSQLLYLSEKKQEMALENETLHAENMKTRFMSLKQQVDPHFLFNSLNTLNSLIKIDTDKAQEYVQQLSFVFRYTLQNKYIITLEEELKFTQAYCHLMQIRYGESLEFVQEIDRQYNSYFIIPLSLQTLVENAIKHSVVSNKQPLTITIRTTSDGMLSIANPIQLKKEKESGEGIGLSNLTERYRLMWKRDIIINTSNNVFEVMIPLIENT